MLHNRKIAIFALGIFTMLLTGCWGSYSSVDNASYLLMNRLKSPSTYKLISGEEVWSGTNQNGKPAYIVRIEYDYQNVFGAILRDCNFVSYFEREDGYLPYRLTQCEEEPVFTRAQAIDLARQLSFEGESPLM